MRGSTDLAELFARYSIETRPPCLEDAVLDAEESLGFTLPSGIRRLLRSSNGLFNSDGQWYFVWPLERIVDGNLALRADGDGAFPAGFVAFGDDAPALLSALRCQGTSRSSGGRRSTLGYACWRTTWTASSSGG
jgi:hypothetical protein